MSTASVHLSAFIAAHRHFHYCQEEVAAYQRRLLRRLVRHAYLNVPYYGRLFDRHGLKPGDIRGVSDLPSIPVTERQDLQSLPLTDILSCDADPARLMTFRTSGSSGKPFTIRRTPPEQRVLRALRVRAMKQMGLRFNDSIALIAGLHETDPHLQPVILRIMERMDPRRRIEIDALLPVGRIRDQLIRFRPDVIIGYASVLARAAELLTQEDRKRIRPRFVQADSEVLTPLMRNQIARGFDAPVFEMYDSHEFNLLAWECAATGELHVCDDGLILEVLKGGRPCAEGERGEVVATNLHAYAMPFIRYRLGDVVTKGAETCRCGLPFSTIRSVQGRMIDYFPLADGRLLHPYDIVNILYDAATWLGQYQLMQERKDRIVLRIVPLAAPPPDGLAGLEARVRSLLGPQVEFQVLLVPRIDIESSGKCRVSRSLVNSAYDGIQWE